MPGGAVCRWRRDVLYIHSIGCRYTTTATELESLGSNEKAIISATAKHRDVGSVNADIIGLGGVTGYPQLKGGGWFGGPPPKDADVGEQLRHHREHSSGWRHVETHILGSRLAPSIRRRKCATATVGEESRLHG